jgi:(p)ppGpp synthase/HD superfamily hydrolase
MTTLEDRTMTGTAEIGVQGATELAAEAHAGQVDKAGQPYISHLIRVRDAWPGTARRP